MLLNEPLTLHPNTASIGIVPPSEGEDSAASFEGPHVLTNEQCVQPAQKAKLMRIPIVDSDITHQLVAHGSNSSRSSRSSNNNSNNNSSSRSSDSSSEGPSGAD